MLSDNMEMPDRAPEDMSSNRRPALSTATAEKTMPPTWDKNIFVDKGASIYDVRTEGGEVGTFREQT